MEPDSRIWANPDLLKVWIWCLGKATFHDKKWVSLKSGRGYVDVEINRGQFVYGRHSAGEETGLSPSTIRDRMNKLEKLGFLDIKPAKQYSIVTICNYEYYQGRETESPTTKTTTAPIGNRSPNLIPTDTKKNDKKDKNVKKSSPLRSEDKEDSSRCSESLCGFEKFWKAYPKRNGKRLERKAALTQFSRLKETEIPLVMVAVKHYSDSGQIPKDAFRWLRDRCWDEWQTPAVKEREKTSVEKAVKALERRGY